MNVGVTEVFAVVRARLMEGDRLALKISHRAPQLDLCRGAWRWHCGEGWWSCHA